MSITITKWSEMVEKLTPTSLISLHFGGRFHANKRKKNEGVNADSKILKVKLTLDPSQ